MVVTKYTNMVISNVFYYYLPTSIKANVQLEKYTHTHTCSSWTTVYNIICWFIILCKVKVMDNNSIYTYNNIRTRTVLVLKIPLTNLHTFIHRFNPAASA